MHIANTTARFLFVMDPYESLNLETETSLLLMQALIDRGQAVFYLPWQDVGLIDGSPIGRVHAVRHAEPYRSSASTWMDLNRFDVVVTRKDPPFDGGYLHLTLILDHLDPKVLQINEVDALRTFNEKLLPLRWPSFAPPTVVSMNAERLADFTAAHREVVLKPLDDCSGRGISKLAWDEQGAFRAEIDEALSDPNGKPRYLLAQKYLGEVKKGDKRVFLVNGDPVGVVNRIPAPGQFLANIHQGAMCRPAGLGDRERRIIDTIKPFLIDHGIFLAGADFIGGYLTELNITSPSALRQINEVTGGALEYRIVDAMLARLARHRRGGVQKSSLKSADYGTEMRSVRECSHAV